MPRKASNSKKNAQVRLSNAERLNQSGRHSYKSRSMLMLSLLLGEKARMRASFKNVLYSKSSPLHALERYDSGFPLSLTGRGIEGEGRDQPMLNQLH